MLKSMVADRIAYAEVTIADGSPRAGELVRDAAFRRRYDVVIVGLRRREGYRLTNLAFVPLRAGDRVLVQGRHEAIEQLEKQADFSAVRVMSEQELAERYRSDERLFVVRVPKESALAGETLAASRIGEAFDFRVLAFFRDGELNVMPKGDELLEGGDLLLIEGQPADLDVLRGLQDLDIDTRCRRTSPRSNPNA